MNISADSKLEVDRIACVCPGQWLYLCGDEGFVYSEARNRFAGMDAAGVAAYRALDAGVPVEDLRQIRSEHGQDTAAGTLDAIYALSQGIFPGDDLVDVLFDSVSSTLTPTDSVNIELNGLPISLSYPAGPWEELCLDCFRNCIASDVPARWHLSAQPTQEYWAIHINERKIFSLQHEEQLGLGLMHAARSLLYAHGEYDVAFHAAMVSIGNSGIMLCAPREFGKSTLTAYLLAQGFDFLTDEPALLHLNTWSVSPIRMPISLKEGSWSVLERQWPRLADAPVHLRSDGTRIRMAHPSPTGYSSRPRTLTQIVFPRYMPSSSPEMELLTPFHTLRLLNEGGMLVANHLVREDFESLLRSVWQTPAYRIQYGSLEEAHEMLMKICRVGK